MTSFVMHLGVRFSKTLLCLGAMLFKGGHTGKDTKPVKFIREIRAIRGLKFLQTVLARIFSGVTSGGRPRKRSSTAGCN